MLPPAVSDKPPLVWIIHAFGGSPAKFWYRRLAAELQDAGCEVEVLRMSSPQAPKIDNWLGDLDARAEENASRDDGSHRKLCLIGHSVGCQAIIRWLAEPQTPRLLEKSRLQLQGVLCVAAWFRVVEPWPEIEPWVRQEIDCGAARQLLASNGSSLDVILSDNDKYTPDYGENAAAWVESLGATVQVVAGQL